MAWPGLSLKLLVQAMLVCALAGITAGCFQPLYGEKATIGGDGIADRMRAVEVAPVAAPSGGRLARVAVEIRNEAIYGLTGGGTPNTTSYRLVITIAYTNLAVVTDPTTGRADVQNYGLDASYQLIDVGTGKSLLTSTTFSRVSYNLPGQQQRFAGDRALRDAETRAAKVIAENIRSRLASYFTAGT